MNIKQAHLLYHGIAARVNELMSIEFIDKIISTEFLWEKLNSVKYHIENYQSDGEELDEDWLYEMRDEITADLEEAYALIEKYETIEDYEPSEF